MFCDRCGANLQGPVSFCPHCGRQFGAAPPLPVVNRVSAHVRNVAIAWLVYSAIRVLPGLFLNHLAGWDFPWDGNAPFFVRGIVRGSNPPARSRPMISMLDPKTLTVFVTGATAGFGAAVCRRFHEAGA